MKLDAYIRRLACGDKSAFKPIYDDTYKGAYYTALSVLGENSLAEDVVQDAYLSVIANAGTYKDGNARAWIIRIVRNTAINLKNRRKREVSVDEQEEAHLFGTYSVDGGGDIKEIARKNLAEDEFNILMLSAVCGYKRREISLMMEMPLPTVSWKYSQAVKKMKKILSEIGGTEL